MSRESLNFCIREKELVKHNLDVSKPYSCQKQARMRRIWTPWPNPTLVFARRSPRCQYHEPGQSARSIRSLRIPTKDQRPWLAKTPPSLSSRHLPLSSNGLALFECLVHLRSHSNPCLGLYLVVMNFSSRSDAITGSCYVTAISQQQRVSGLTETLSSLTGCSGLVIKQCNGCNSQ